MSAYSHSFTATFPVKDAAEAEATAQRMCADYFGEAPFYFDVSTEAIVDILGKVLGCKATVRAEAHEEGDQ